MKLNTLVLIKIKKQTSTIDKLYESYKEEKNEYYPVLKKADIYDPLRLGIDTGLFENEESTFDEDTKYSMYGPRFDGDKDHVLFMNYTESSLDNTMIGEFIVKSTMIKRTYFKRKWYRYENI